MINEELKERKKLNERTANEWILSDSHTSTQSSISPWHRFSSAISFSKMQIFHIFRVTTDRLRLTTASTTAAANLMHQTIIQAPFIVRHKFGSVEWHRQLTKSGRKKNP